jgi:hypothetical protein
MRIYAVLVLWACAGVAHAASYSTYIGDAYQYQVSALATDTAGNSYLTGSRIVVPASTVNTGPITDVFVSKLDATGNLTVPGHGQRQGFRSGEWHRRGFLR